MRLSVIIPTRDRPQQLARTLESLAQAQDRGFEVIVVDDGSQPPVNQPPLRCPNQLLRQEGQGPATARNLGIKAARGERVLLLGDDTALAPGALARHLWAEKGLQGKIDWDPKSEVTPLMDFLAPNGPQFYFRHLQTGRPVPYWSVLGSNLSAPTEWFRKEPFDEGFPHAALEDTEMAFRWAEQGWKVLFDESAIAWHDHRYDDIEPFLERQKRAGRAARYAIGRHRRLVGKLLYEPVFQEVTAPLRALFGRSRPRQPRDWEHACRRAYLAGLFG